MFKKYLTLALAVLVVNLSLGVSVFADGKADKAARFAEKVKASVARLGTGENARVEVKLKDGAKLKGYVSEIGDAGFVVTNAETKTATPVSYSNAKQVKGNNLSTGVQIALAVGLIAALIAIFVIAGNS